MGEKQEEKHAVEVNEASVSSDAEAPAEEVHKPTVHAEPTTDDEVKAKQRKEAIQTAALEAARLAANPSVQSPAPGAGDTKQG